MVRKRRAAARAVRHDLVALVEQVLVPEIFQDPPDRLDIFVGVGHIGIFQVHPKGDAVGQFLPILDVGKDGLLAKLVEFVDAVFFDLLFVGEAKLLLDFDLDRQAVRIPAAAARDVIAAHDLVAREHILEGARQHMVHARLAIGGRRSFIKHILGSALALLDGLLEDLGLLPKLQHVFFHRSDIEFWDTGLNIVSLLVS